MKTSITLENIKCNGCATRISNKMTSLPNIKEVEIDLDSGTVVYDHSDESEAENVKKVLKAMGYPEKRTGNSIDNAKSISVV